MLLFLIARTLRWHRLDPDEPTARMAVLRLPGSILDAV
jgi:hypothetical protein